MTDYFVRQKPHAREWEVVTSDAPAQDFGSRHEALEWARRQRQASGGKVFVWDAQGCWMQDEPPTR